MAEQRPAPAAAGASEEQHQQAHADGTTTGKVPLHRVALHATGQPRAPHHNGENGMPFAVSMSMYKENRAKLCARLTAKVGRLAIESYLDRTIPPTNYKRCMPNSWPRARRRRA